MKVVVGLGNPGQRYGATRHNAGFMVLDLLADRLGLAFARMGHQARLAEGRWKGQKVLLVKPETFMNLSGRAVGEVVRYYKLPLEDLLVVYDDLDLEPGRLRFRPGGGAGGHKGMGSIQEVLGSTEIPRLRVGIGRAPAQWEVQDYVLAPFLEEEWLIMQKLLPMAAAAVEDWVGADINQVMNKYNN